MANEDFELIIIESLMHDYKQPFFKDKKPTNCTPKEYFTGLLDAFKRLYDKVNETDYSRVLITMPGGKTFDYELEEGHHSEQIELLKKEYGEGAKSSFPHKKPINIEEYTKGKFRGKTISESMERGVLRPDSLFGKRDKLTVEVMENIWSDLNPYLQSIIDEISNTVDNKALNIQELKNELLILNGLWIQSEVNQKNIHLLTDKESRQESKYIIKDYKGINLVYDLCNKEIFECEFDIFWQSIEAANFGRINIRTLIKVQDLTYRLSGIMDKAWYSDICKCMKWKKSTCSGQGSKLSTDQWTRKIDKILPRPQRE